MYIVYVTEEPEIKIFHWDFSIHFHESSSGGF